MDQDLGDVEAGSGSASNPDGAICHDAGGNADSGYVCSRDGVRTTAGAGVLAAVICNTTTELGLFCGGELAGTFDTTTPDSMTADEARLKVEQALYVWDAPRPCGSILASVVPSLSEVWRRALASSCDGRVLVVGPGLKSGLRMCCDDPGEVGADRVADVVAARRDYGPPVVAVDLGTTSTFEVVDAGGSYAGGIIAPGLALGAHSLSAAAARLPEIELRAPVKAIGRNTRSAMQSGVVLGEVARIDGLLDAIMDELGEEADVVLTGTHADSLAPLLHHRVQVDSTLTLRGLFYLWERNSC